MTTIGEFTSLLLKDMLIARRQADAFSASVSEEYHKDSFMNKMPVPHYTISEIEADVPFQIIGIKRAQVTQESVDRIIMRIDGVLPTSLYRGIKNAYYSKQEKLAVDCGAVEPQTVGIPLGQVKPEQRMVNEDEQDIVIGEIAVIRLSSRPELKACYKATTADISYLMSQHMRVYLNEKNIEIIKLLDFADAFEKTLYSLCKEQFGTYQDYDTPFIDKPAMKKTCAIISDSMFFEFKQAFESMSGVVIDPVTSKLNEYANGNAITRLKFKIKEQDLDFVVDEGEETGEDNRFLTLN